MLNNACNNKKIYACFVDFKKAFDSVWHDGLFYKLLDNKIGGRFYDLIKNMYSNTRFAVKISDCRTSFFSYHRRVRQGCVLTPLLFNIYINELPKLLEKQILTICITKWYNDKQLTLCKRPLIYSPSQNPRTPK
jgi:hypothetical protein